MAHYAVKSGDIQMVERLNQFPQGGGHARAAGVTLLMLLEEAERLVIAELERALKIPITA